MFLVPAEEREPACRQNAAGAVEAAELTSDGTGPDSVSTGRCGHAARALILKCRRIHAGTQRNDSPSKVRGDSEASGQLVTAGNLRVLMGTSSCM